MAERSKAAVLKTAVRETGPGVRIPLPPPPSLSLRCLEGEGFRHRAARSARRDVARIPGVDGSHLAALGLGGGRGLPASRGPLRAPRRGTNPWRRRVSPRCARAWRRERASGIARPAPRAATWHESLASTGLTSLRSGLAEGEGFRHRRPAPRAATWRIPGALPASGIARPAPRAATWHESLPRDPSLHRPRREDPGARRGLPRQPAAASRRQPEYSDQRRGPTHSW
jgi:hypothetical protein